MENAEILQALIEKNQALERQLKEASEKIEKLTHIIEEKDIIHLNNKDFNRLFDDLCDGDVSHELIQKLAAGKYEFDFEDHFEDHEKAIRNFENLVYEEVADLIKKEGLGNKEENERKYSYFYDSDKNVFIEVKKLNYKQVSGGRQPLVNINETKAPEGFKDFWNKLENYKLSQQEIDLFREKLKENDATFLHTINEKLECNEKCLKGRETETFKIYETLAKNVKNETITPKEYYNGVFKIEDLEEDIYVPKKYLDAVENYLLDLVGSTSRMYELDSTQDAIDEEYDPNLDEYIYEELFEDVILDADCNALIYHSGVSNGNIIKSENASANRAPEWFKSGYEGIVNKTLGKNEFIDFLDKLKNEKEIGLRSFYGVQSEIKSFLKHLEENKEVQSVICCKIPSTNKDFFENAAFPEDEKCTGKLYVIHFQESNKYLELFSPIAAGWNLQTQIVDNLEKSYLNTLLETTEMYGMDFLQLLEYDDLNKSGLTAGIDSYIQKYEKDSPDKIYKVSELLPDVLKTSSFEKFSDNLLIEMENKVFIYQPSTEQYTSAISKPFNDNEMAIKLEEASRMRGLTQQYQDKYSGMQKMLELTRDSLTSEKQEIATIKKNIQEKRVAVATKIEDCKNKESSVEQLEKTLEVRQNQKYQLDRAVSHTWNDVYNKQGGKAAFQKYILEHETELCSIKKEIETYSGANKYRHQKNINENVKGHNSKDKLKSAEELLDSVILEMGDK